MQLSLFPSIFRKDQVERPRVRHSELNSLKSHLSSQALEIFTEQAGEQPPVTRIVRHRTSKSGDYRAPYQGKPARITVNGNLNPYAFLITLIHELAHHEVWIHHEAALRKMMIRRKSRPLPHGKEWKRQFHRLMQPYLGSGMFPPDLFRVLVSFLENPKASSSVDHQLSIILRKYDPPDQTVRLEELPHDAVFTLHGRRTFRKKEKVRTRYRCICLKTNRLYLVSPGAPVVAV